MFGLFGKRRQQDEYVTTSSVADMVSAQMRPVVERAFEDIQAAHADRDDVVRKNCNAVVVSFEVFAALFAAQAIYEYMRFSEEGSKRLAYKTLEIAIARKSDPALAEATINAAFDLCAEHNVFACRGQREGLMRGIEIAQAATTDAELDINMLRDLVRETNRDSRRAA